jgi:hypothetical protein
MWTVTADITEEYDPSSIVDAFIRNLESGWESDAAMWTEVGEDYDPYGIGSFGGAD